MQLHLHAAKTTADGSSYHGLNGKLDSRASKLGSALAEAADE